MCQHKKEKILRVFLALQVSVGCYDLDHVTLAWRGNCNVSKMINKQTYFQDFDLGTLNYILSTYKGFFAVVAIWLK